MRFAMTALLIFALAVLLPGVVFAGESGAVCEVAVYQPDRIVADFEQYARAVNQLFESIVGSGVVVDVRIFRRESDLAAYLKKSDPALGFFNKPVPQSVLEEGFALQYEAGLSSNRSGGLVAVTGHMDKAPEKVAISGEKTGDAVAEFLQGMKRVETTSDRSALIAVRMGSADVALVGKASFDDFRNSSPASMQTGLQIIKTFDDESSAAIFAVPDRLPKAIAAAVSKNFASVPVTQTAATLGLSRFAEPSRVPTVSMPMTDGGIYVVRAGDTLVEIAHRVYGRWQNYVLLAQANNILDINLIYVGQELKVPPAAKKAGA